MHTGVTNLKLINCTIAAAMCSDSSVDGTPATGACIPCPLLPESLQWLTSQAPAFPIHSSQVSYQLCYNVEVCNIGAILALFVAHMLHIDLFT